MCINVLDWSLSRGNEIYSIDSEILVSCIAIYYDMLLLNLLFDHLKLTILKIELKLLFLLISCAMEIRYAYNVI